MKICNYLSLLGILVTKTVVAFPSMVMEDSLLIGVKEICASVYCHNKGECDFTDHGTQCNCNSGYSGTNCEIKELGRHENSDKFQFCPGAYDNLHGSKLWWNKTFVGNEVMQICLPGSLGIVFRSCVSAPDEHGIWEDPDISSCTNAAIIDWLAKVYLQALKSDSGPTEGHQQALDLLEGLNAATKEAVTDDILYTSDITIGVWALSNIGQQAHYIKNLSANAEDISEAFCSTVDILTSSPTHQVWQSFTDMERASEIARDVIFALESIAESIANDDNYQEEFEGYSLQENSKQNGLNIALEKENVGFTLKPLSQIAPSNGYITVNGQNESTTISIPYEAIENAKKMQNNSNKTAAYLYSAQLHTISKILQLNPVPKDRDPNQTLNYSSDITTLTLLGLPSEAFKNLSSPVILTFKHQNDIQDEDFESLCVYLNTSVPGGTTDNLWSRHGCEAAHVNTSHTICHCYHLSHFALLLDLYGIGGKISKHHHVALSLITYLGGSLSVLGCLSSIVIYEYFRLSSERIRIHEMLATSILITQILFFAGFDRTEVKVVCKVFAILLHYALLSVFCWMLVEGIHLYVSLIKVFQRSSHFKKYLLLGWGLPFVNVFISCIVYFDHYARDERCWLSLKLMLIAFLPFVVFTILANFLVLVLVLRVMYNSSKINKSREDISYIRSGVKAALILLPLLGFTWCFGFLSVDKQNTLVFTYLFTITNSLQGFLFFILHCVRNNEVKRAYSRRYGSHGKTNNSSSENGVVPPSAFHRGFLRDSLVGHRNVKRCSAYSTSSMETAVSNVDDKEEPMDSSKTNIYRKRNRSSLPDCTDPKVQEFENVDPEVPDEETPENATNL